MKICKTVLSLSLCILIFLTGCTSPPADHEVSFESWGSFTPYKTYSYDEKYYAIQKVEKNFIHGFNYIKVCIYETETDAFVAYFYPARSMDFWGICWESDSYNIWIQSGDIGVHCYKYEDMQWIMDTHAERPDDIISKYDKSDDISGNESNGEGNQQ